jgi:lysylphosphatidylglycerol synthetase-like protein (DUF2156 family)
MPHEYENGFLLRIFIFIANSIGWVSNIILVFTFFVFFSTFLGLHIGFMTWGFFNTLVNAFSKEVFEMQTLGGILSLVGGAGGLLFGLYVAYTLAKMTYNPHNILSNKIVKVPPFYTLKHPRPAREKVLLVFKKSGAAVLVSSIIGIVCGLSTGTLAHFTKSEPVLIFTIITAPSLCLVALSPKLQILRWAAVMISAVIISGIISYLLTGLALLGCISSFIVIEALSQLRTVKKNVQFLGYTSPDQEKDFNIFTKIWQLKKPDSISWKKLHVDTDNIYSPAGMMYPFNISEISEKGIFDTEILNFLAYYPFPDAHSIPEKFPEIPTDQNLSAHERLSDSAKIQQIMGSL